MRALSNRRLSHRWEKLRTSYYFVPSVMLLLAVLAATGLVGLDRWLHERGTVIPWLRAGTPEGARAVLSAIAASIITVAGVVFSITIATLTQASNQFGPRLLRNFMRDAGNQLVLGTFVATFVYCLVVLRAVDGPEAVPHLSVNGAVVIAVFCIYLLVYFIHHTSFSLQAPQVAAMVWHDLRRSIDKMFPLTLGHDGPVPENRERPFPPAFYELAIAIDSPHAGYLQAIDETELLDVLVGKDLRCELRVRPGDFVVEGNPLLYVWPPERVTTEVATELRDLFLLGRHRTDEQDLEFSIDQLSEIAVRALSPGINDPYTAMNCVDWLGDAICRIAEHDRHSPYRYDDQGTLRIIARVTTFEGVVSAAMDHIRQYGRDSAPVTIRLLEMIAAVALRIETEEHRQPLREQAMMIARQAKSTIPEPADHEAVAARYRIAIERLR